MRKLRSTVMKAGVGGLCNLFMWLNVADAVITWYLVHSGRSFELNPFLKFMLNWDSAKIMPFAGFVAMKTGMAGAIVCALTLLRRKLNVGAILRVACAAFAAIVLFNFAQTLF